MSSIESRVLSLIRSETGVLKQQLIRLEQSNGRLENTISSLKTDVADMKDVLDDIRGNLTSSFVKLIYNSTVFTKYL